MRSDWPKQYKLRAFGQTLEIVEFNIGRVGKGWHKIKPVGGEFLFTITLSLGGFDDSLARSAAQWMCAFHKDASALVGEHGVTLESHKLREEELERIWNAALLNERAYAENEGKRRQLLEQLSR